MRWYSTDFSDFAYPWKAFCALWSNIWETDKNPSAASKQLQGLTLSKRGFLFPYRIDLLCIFYWAVLIPQRCTAAMRCPKCILRLINTECACLKHVVSLLRDTCERVRRRWWRSQKSLFLIFSELFILFSTATPHERIKEVNELFSQGPRQYVQTALSHVS